MTDPSAMRSLFKKVYVLICAFFVSIVAYAATYGAFSDQGPATESVSEAGGAAPMNLADCQKALPDLENGLHAAAGRVFAIRTIVEKRKAWSQEMNDWRTRLEQWTSRCNAKGRGAVGELRRARKQLLRAEFAYETALKRFAEIAKKPLERLQAETLP